MKGSIFEIDKGFQTPLPVCDVMAQMVPYYCKKIFEPTPGEGNIVRSLNAHGFLNITTPPQGDFFLMDRNERFDCIVMNPPFSGKTAFTENAAEEVGRHGLRVGYYILKECMQMSDTVIALMPWFTLTDSDVRLRFIKEYGLRSLTSLPRKTFQYARIQTVILEMQKGYEGETIFRTMQF